MSYVNFASITAGSNVTIGPLIERQFDAQETRSNRTTLLDGTVHIHRGGTVVGDRTKLYTAWVNAANRRTLKALFDAGAFVIMSDEDGCYKALIQRYMDALGKVELTIWIKERLDV